MCCEEDEEMKRRGEGLIWLDGYQYCAVRWREVGRVRGCIWFKGVSVFGWKNKKKRI